MQEYKKLIQQNDPNLIVSYLTSTEAFALDQDSQSPVFWGAIATLLNGGFTNDSRSKVMDSECFYVANSNELKLAKLVLSSLQMYEDHHIRWLVYDVDQNIYITGESSERLKFAITSYFVLNAASYIIQELPLRWFVSPMVDLISSVNDTLVNWNFVLITVFNHNMLITLALLSFCFYHPDDALPGGFKVRTWHHTLSGLFSRDGPRLMIIASLLLIWQILAIADLNFLHDRKNVDYLRLLGFGQIFFFNLIFYFSSSELMIHRVLHLFFLGLTICVSLLLMEHVIEISTQRKDNFEPRLIKMITLSTCFTLLNSILRQNPSQTKLTNFLRVLCITSEVLLLAESVNWWNLPIEIPANGVSSFNWWHFNSLKLLFREGLSKAKVYGLSTVDQSMTEL